MKTSLNNTRLLIALVAIPPPPPHPHTLLPLALINCIILVVMHLYYTVNVCMMIISRSIQSILYYYTHRSQISMVHKSLVHPVYSHLDGSVYLMLDNSVKSNHDQFPIDLINDSPHCGHPVLHIVHNMIYILLLRVTFTKLAKSIIDNSLHHNISSYPWRYHGVVQKRCHKNAINFGTVQHHHS